MNKDMEPIKTCIDALTYNGYLVYVFDFNGHGKSEGEFKDMTISSEIEDLKRVIEYFINDKQVASISLLGHSQGALVASFVASSNEYSIQRIILLAPAFSIDKDIKNGHFFCNRFDPNNLPEFIPVFDGKIYKKYLFDALNLDVDKNVKGYKGKVDIIYGDEDELIEKEWFDHAKSKFSNVNSISINRGNHELNNVLDELYNQLKIITKIESITSPEEIVLKSYYELFLSSLICEKDYYFEQFLNVFDNSEGEFKNEYKDKIDDYYKNKFIPLNEFNITSEIISSSAVERAYYAYLETHSINDKNDFLHWYDELDNYYLRRIDEINRKIEFEKENKNRKSAVLFLIEGKNELYEVKKFFNKLYSSRKESLSKKDKWDRFIQIN